MLMRLRVRFRRRLLWSMMSRDFAEDLVLISSRAFGLIVMIAICFGLCLVIVYLDGCQASFLSRSEFEYSALRSRGMNGILSIL